MNKISLSQILLAKQDLLDAILESQEAYLAWQEGGDEPRYIIAEENVNKTLTILIATIDGTAAVLPDADEHWEKRKVWEDKRCELERLLNQPFPWDPCLVTNETLLAWSNADLAIQKALNAHDDVKPLSPLKT